MHIGVEVFCAYSRIFSQYNCFSKKERIKYCFSVHLKKEIEINQMNSITYSLDLTLSNKYLERIIQSLEPKVFNKKLEVLLY